MATMVTEVYDALVSAGASDEKARSAATAIAGYDQSKLKADLAELSSETTSEITALRVEMRSEFAASRAETKAEFAALRAEMSADRADMKAEFASVRAELATEGDRTDVAVLKWGMGLTVAMLASLIAKAFF